MEIKKKFLLMKNNIRFQGIKDIVYEKEGKNGNLGWGGFATVRLMHHKDHPEFKFAVKKIKKGDVEENRFIE